MENTQLQSLYQTFDDIRHEEEGVEFWYARELYPLLGYTKWENFETALQRARVACETARGNVSDHFPGARKKTIIGHGIEKEIDDIKLTRYACYLITINSDPRKQETVPFASSRVAFFIYHCKLEPCPAIINTQK